MSNTSETRDFSDELHDLRMRELPSLPKGARTVLHGGAADRWYLQWFEEHYPDTTIERHIMVEAFQEEPPDLPDNATWLKRTLGDMSGVDDASVDLVFAGQVIEHLWPDDVVGFLLESRRVLRDGGALVLDSPNRHVTEAIDWLHPQHTFELSVDEVVGLARAAGFDVVGIRGILLSYDEGNKAFIPIETFDLPHLSWEQRADLAKDRPEDSFIWWLEVTPRPGDHGDRELLLAQAHGCFERFRARRLLRFNTVHPVHRPTTSPPEAHADGEGMLAHGPYFPVDHGDWRATFSIKAPDSLAGHEDDVVAWIDVCSDYGTTGHGRRDVLGRDLIAGVWTEVPLHFTLEQMIMGIELRAYCTGVVPLHARLTARLERPEDVVHAPPVPEPRARELARDIADKVGQRARYEQGRLTRRYGGSR